MSKLVCVVMKQVSESVSWPRSKGIGKQLRLYVCKSVGEAKLSPLFVQLVSHFATTLEMIMSGDVKNQRAARAQPGRFRFEWENPEDKDADPTRAARMCGVHLESSHPIVSQHTTFHYSGDKGQGGGLVWLH